MISALCDSRMSAGMRRGIVPVFLYSVNLFRESCNTMIPLIVACHGRFAEELVKSAAMVYGEAERVHAVTFMPGEGPDDLLRKYEGIVAAESSPEAVLLLVDLFGGSPYNAAVRLAAVHDGMDVLSGVNLPMLLELLDSRDEKSTVPQLVENAYNASREGTKAFRTPLAAVAPAAPVAEVAPAADRRAGRPTSGHMQIPLLRIDNRLIHGQVASSWAKVVKCDAIFAIDDDVAKDPLRAKLLLQVAPAHLQAYVIPVDKAIKVWHNPMYADRKVLWLVSRPGDVVRLIEGGVDIKKVNVGGMTHREGCKLISQAVAIDADDLAAFKKLHDMGVKMTLQQLPTNAEEDVMPKLANIHF